RDPRPNACKTHPSRRHNIRTARVRARAAALQAALKRDPLACGSQREPMCCAFHGDGRLHACWADVSCEIGGIEELTRRTRKTRLRLERAQHADSIGSNPRNSFAVVQRQRTARWLPMRAQPEIGQ